MDYKIRELKQNEISVLNTFLYEAIFISDGVEAQYNWQVVEKLVNLIRAMGLEPATPDEARQMLKLRKR